MAVGNFMKSSGIAALVAGLAVMASPVLAQERGNWGGRGGGNATAQNSDSGRSGWRGNGGGSRGFRSEQPAAAQAQARSQAQTQAQGQPRAQRNWSRRDTAEGTNRWQGRTDGNRWNGSRSRTVEQAQAAPVQQQPRQIEGQRRAWSGSSQWQSRDRDGDRNRDRAAATRSWRDDGNRDLRRSDSWRGNDRRAYSSNWNRDWRRDNRYDWRGWRSSNRDVFRLGTYYAPYRNYSYRRLSSGFYLDTLFFGSRYWINDPWQYRLPPAYGPYRWVRYYDDALLVDTYSGEVVDVIYDFFW